MNPLPERLQWILEILQNAHPSRVEPHTPDMRHAAHWAWSLKYALRHFEDASVTYSISDLGRAALEGGDA